MKRLFARKKPQTSADEIPVARPVYLPEDCATPVANLIWESKFPEASHLAEKVSLALPAGERRAYFDWAAGYAGTIAFWYRSWDYSASLDAFEHVVEQLEKGPSYELLPAMICIARGELEMVRSEQQWMIYDLPAACRTLELASRAYRLGEEKGRLAMETDRGDDAERSRWIDLVVKLGRSGYLYAECQRDYLAGFQAVIERKKNAGSQARKLLGRIDAGIEDLLQLGDPADAQEILAFRRSLQKRLELSANPANLLGYENVSVSWTFRRHFPASFARSLYALCTEEPVERDVLLSERIFRVEQMIDLPVLHITPSVLNDIFASSLGEENFNYVELAFPVFQIDLPVFPTSLHASPMARFYTSGVVAVYFQIDNIPGKLETHQVQLLRFIGPEQSPGMQISVEWLSPDPFENLQDIARSLLDRLLPFFNKIQPNTGETGNLVEDAQNGVAWLYHTYIQALRMHLPGEAARWVSGCELAAISTSLQESYDSLDPWMELSYDVSSNLAVADSRLANIDLFFISGDHTFIYAPSTAGWVLTTYLDLIEFGLNLSALTSGVLFDLDSEIKGLQKTMQEYDFTSKDQQGLIKALKQVLKMQEIHSLRLHQLKASVLNIRNLNHLARVTRFDEYRTILQKTAEAVSLPGALVQAENLVETLIETQDGFRQFSQHLYEELNLIKEQNRSRAEGLVVLIIQILGISQIVSSIASLLVIEDQQVITLPWIWGGRWIFDGATLKLAGLIGFFSGVLLISLAWFFTFNRKKGEKGAA